MIDLSNNNGSVNFREVARHHTRVYLKRSEGTDFIDKTFESRLRDAHAAGMKVGAYHFARPSRNSPREEADFFLRLAPQLVPGRSMRHMLDIEDPNVKPSLHVGEWAIEFLAIVYHHTGRHMGIYSYGSYLERCQFAHIKSKMLRSTWLWLAAYGRNDGKEYPYVIPAPWTKRTLLAHQYASTAHVPGCSEPVDISHVLQYRKIDITRLRRH